MESYLLDNVDKIRHIPATIIQGRYDVTTPMKTAWDLHKVNQGCGVLIDAFPIKKMPQYCSCSNGQKLNFMWCLMLVTSSWSQGQLPN